jgi:hypothetical protein
MRGTRIPGTGVLMRNSESRRRATSGALWAALAVFAFSAGCARAEAPAPAEDAAAGGSAVAEPSEPGFQLSALAPENLKKERPAPPFDLTGNWFIDTEDGKNPEAWRFGPPYPKLTPAAQVHFDASQKAAAEGKVYRDDIAECYPAGLPLIMTRYWPMAMIQLPTAVYMVSGFMNSFRTVFLDGRQHTDPELAIATANGESIGRWEGDTLVVDTRYFVDDRHWMDQGGRSIPAGDQLHVIERIRLLEDVDKLEIEYIMTDPEHWEGEWRSTKRFVRVNDADISEVVCTPDLNEHLKSTSSSAYIR